MVFIYYALFTGSVGYGIIATANGSMFNIGYIISALIILSAVAIIIRFGVSSEPSLTS